MIRVLMQLKARRVKRLCTLNLSWFSSLFRIAVAGSLGRVVLPEMSSSLLDPESRTKRGPPTIKDETLDPGPVSGRPWLLVTDLAILTIVK
ncbi:hypothetical protein TNCV_2003791 [Trichonephila clavipes]|nr:hypothetical protein TNCV_2003791 [Trichonephila clavipes]